MGKNAPVGCSFRPENSRPLPLAEESRQDFEARRADARVVGIMPPKRGRTLVSKCYMVAANEKLLWCNACTVEKDFANPTGHCTGKAKSKLKSRAKQLASSGSSDSPVSSPVSKRRNNQISPRKRSSRQKRPAADSSESCGAEARAKAGIRSELDNRPDDPNGFKMVSGRSAEARVKVEALAAQVSQPLAIVTTNSMSSSGSCNDSMDSNQLLAALDGSSENGGSSGGGYTTPKAPTKQRDQHNSRGGRGSMDPKCMTL